MAVEHILVNNLWSHCLTEHLSFKNNIKFLLHPCRTVVLDDLFTDWNLKIQFLFFKNLFVNNKFLFIGQISEIQPVQYILKYLENKEVPVKILTTL